jgi:CBS domain-containing protein
VRADQIAEEFPIVSAASNALGAGRLMAEQRLPGLLVTDGEGKPLAILPASEVVRMLVPGYVQDDPSLAGVLNESMADHIADAIGDKTVSAILPKPLPELPTVKSDDTIVEVAAVMAHRRAPLVAVVDEGRLVGVITASRLLEVALER